MLKEVGVGSTFDGALTIGANPLNSWSVTQGAFSFELSRRRSKSNHEGLCGIKFREEFACDTYKGTYNDATRAWNILGKDERIIKTLVH